MLKIIISIKYIWIYQIECVKHVNYTNFTYSRWCGYCFNAFVFARLSVCWTKSKRFSCQTFTRKASSMFLKSTRNDRYFPWGALAVATAIITAATKTGYMDESWSLSGITSASIYSSCSFARCTRHRRSRPQKKFDFIFISFRKFVLCICAPQYVKGKIVRE